MFHLLKYFLLVYFIIGLFYNSFSQKKIIYGVVIDKRSKDPIVFGSVFLKKNGSGSNTDVDGNFLFQINKNITFDTIIVKNVGYTPLLVPIDLTADTTFVELPISVLPVYAKATVTVSAKYNRNLWFWHKIMKKKPFNDPNELVNYSATIYNKLQLDINNIKKNGLLKKSGLFKPFDFIFNFIQSDSTRQNYLPIFLTETISDFYYQRNPFKTREVIKASKTNGIKNETIIQLIGTSVINKVNIYANNIFILGKSFIGPFSTHADNFYHFKLGDTQYVANHRIIHFFFWPLRRGDNVFTGDCWVTDTSFAIQRITMRPSNATELNVINNLYLYQESKLINDSIWFMSKQKVITDIVPITKKAISFTLTKTLTYSNIQFNKTYITDIIKQNTKIEDVASAPNITQSSDSFWINNREEDSLNKQEKGIYTMIDSVEHNKYFKLYKGLITTLVGGYYNVGAFQFGPWYSLASYNTIEGLRLRADLGTSKKFSNKLYLHGYIAYGFLDNRFKPLGEAIYVIKNKPWFYIHALYVNDIDNGQTYYNDIGNDNIFTIAVRKPNIPYKILNIENRLLEIYKENRTGFSALLSMSQKKFTPLTNLPTLNYFQTSSNQFQPINTFETAIMFRYAYRENTYNFTPFYRTSLGSRFPIIEIRYAKGIPGFLKSSYDYTRIDFKFYVQNLNISPLGKLYAGVFGGRVFGTVPFPLLAIQPGNEIFYYNGYAFNLMNRFQYITDRYLGFQIEHNIGGGIFKLSNITRRWRLRQFWTAKGVWGNLSPSNEKLNFVGVNNFMSLNNKLYLEVGTGIDNILKYFRIDCIWRVLPTPLPSNSFQRFGIFFSFHLNL